MRAVAVALILAGVIYLLHAVAGAPAEQAEALAGLLAGALLCLSLALPASRRRVAGFAASQGWLAPALALLGALLLGSKALLLFTSTTGLAVLAAIAAGLGLSRLAGRRPLVLALTAAGAAAAVVGVLALLSADQPPAPPPTDKHAEVAAISAVSLIGAVFLLGEETSRAASRPGGLPAPAAQLRGLKAPAPLRRRLAAPAALAVAAVLGLGFAQSPGAVLAVALGAGAMAGAFWARRAKPAALLAGLAAGASLLLLAAPSPAGALRLGLPTPDLELGAALGAFVAATLIAARAQDAARRPSRGFALALGLLVLTGTFSVSGGALISPSATLASALLFGAALSFADQPRRERRGQNALAWGDVTKVATTPEA